MDNEALLNELKVFISKKHFPKMCLMEPVREYAPLSESERKQQLEDLGVTPDKSLLKEYELYMQSYKRPSFRETLFDMIDKKGMKDADIYRRAGIDRRLFSKIRSDETYQTSKRTIFSLIIAMRLTENEAENLLESAGFSFSMSHNFDLIILFFVRKAIYDIDLVNYALLEHQLQPLGCIE
ncbi:XRE family transcriptional regulator [Anoxynatronum sibiricum]|uniref:XRE family transcriptional regulator n=1 Tax=Anoxynatronum sibiricum TaxID=210623 RepID=A0ABU9VY00_9CLOT